MISIGDHKLALQAADGKFIAQCVTARGEAIHPVRQNLKCVRTKIRTLKGQDP
jgi:hypothetical protein